MKIGIDIDEIVTEYLKSFLKFLNNEKKIILNYNGILNYNKINIGTSIPDEDIKDYISEHTSKDLMLVELEVIENSLESINFLDNNHEIYFITSRHPSNKNQTEQFFKKHFPNKSFKFFFSGDAWGGNKSKAEIAFELGCEIMIEDNLKYAKECSSKGIYVILFNKPWNKSKEKIKNLYRVNDWKESLEKIQEIKNSKC